MPNFSDLSTRVKLNPETYIKYEGGDLLLLKNVASEESICIIFDILLIVYELIHWKTVEELIAPWPPGDQQKIIEHLDSLYRHKLIIVDEAEAIVSAPSALSQSLGRNIHINLENHHYMLRDYIRVATYRKAIENQVKPDTLAMDLGCGSGILAFFAAKAGAQQVYAIERRSDVIFLAENLAKANGLDDRITFIQGSSSQIDSERLSPKPNLLIAEILGNAILEENVLEFTLDARDRFLAPGGTMLPYRLDMYGFAFSSNAPSRNRIEEVKEFQDLYGFDFTLLGDVLAQQSTIRTERYNSSLHQAISESVCFHSLDFRTLKESNFAKRFEVNITQDGSLAGFCAYFKAFLDKETILTNSPWAPSTHWTQLLYYYPQPKQVQEGDKITFEVIYDGALRIQAIG